MVRPIVLIALTFLFLGAARCGTMARSEQPSERSDAAIDGSSVPGMRVEDDSSVPGMRVEAGTIPQIAPPPLLGFPDASTGGMSLPADSGAQHPIISVASSLGARCDGDDDCGSDLTCLTSQSEAVFSGGPASGYCSMLCADDWSQCWELGGVCLTAGGGEARCFKACLPGVVNDAGVAGACLGRDDVGCQAVDDTIAICRPICGHDANCPPGYSCNLLGGTCVAGSPPQGDPLGTECDPDGTNTCAAACLRFANGLGRCSAACVVGSGAACGVSISDEAAPGSPTCLSYLDGVEGDLGYCVPSCTCTEHCPTPASSCSQPAPRQAGGAEGYCYPQPSDSAHACDQVWTTCRTASIASDAGGAGLIEQGQTYGPYVVDSIEIEPYLCSGNFTFQVISASHLYLNLNGELYSHVEYDATTVVSDTDASAFYTVDAESLRLTLRSAGPGPADLGQLGQWLFDNQRALVVP